MTASERIRAARAHESWIGYYERLGAEDASDGETCAPWLIAFGHKDYEDAYVRGYREAREAA